MAVTSEVLAKVSSPPYCDPTKRHDFVFLFDVTDGNPNGDPDNGNLPRMDPETMQGLVTDGCIKRKIRNWVDMVYGTEEHYKIYIQQDGIALNTFHERAYTEKNIKPIGPKQKREEVEIVQRWICENFYDVRMFGATMNTQVKCGQVWGPAQIFISRSVSPIMPLILAITRVAITRPEDNKDTEMGRKNIIPYGLYVGRGSFNPYKARLSVITTRDLEIFWEAFTNMWDEDHSAARALDLKGLYVFTHDGPRGRVHHHKLTSRIMPALKEGVSTPRRFEDYDIKVATSDLPDGIILTQLA